MYEIEFFLYSGERSYHFTKTLELARQYVREDTELKWLKVEIHYPKPTKMK